MVKWDEVGEKIAMGMIRILIVVTASTIITETISFITTGEWR